MTCTAWDTTLTYLQINMVEAYCLAYDSVKHTTDLIPYCFVAYIMSIRTFLQSGCIQHSMKTAAFKNRNSSGCDNISRPWIHLFDIQMEVSKEINDSIETNNASATELKDVSTLDVVDYNICANSTEIQ